VERDLRPCRAIPRRSPLQDRRYGIGSRAARLQHQFRRDRKAEELKKRIWFTLGRAHRVPLGTYIPLPGIDPEALRQSFQNASGGVLGLFNMFSGGAVERMAIFALNIMPYISASIIVQLLTSVVPTLEALKKEGESGRKIINQYTRYLTVFLAVFQSWGIAVGLQSSAASSRARVCSS
jgi:preprotein translocase subunit SecY